MAYIREVVGRQDTSRGEIRRLSAVLRRLIVNRDIAKVAVPRIGKIQLHSIDNSHFYNATVRPGSIRLFFTGDVRVYGQYIGSFDLHEVPRKEVPAVRDMKTVLDLMYPKRDLIPNQEPMQIISMNLERFKNQKVICFMGRWISREAVIQYMANLASGVHSDIPSKEEDMMLARLRNVVQISKGESGPHIHFVWETDSPAESVRFKVAPAETVDPVLIELLGAANALTLSPDIDRLEVSIRQELG